MVPTTKKIADLITWARVLLFPMLIWLGLTQGTEAISLVVIIMILNLTLDSIDGPLARSNPSPKQSWIGKNDLAVDMFVTTGLLFYITIAGLISWQLMLLYILLWGIYFWFNGVPHSMGVVYELPMYLVLFVAAFREAPIYLLALVVILVIALIVTWPKFLKESLPEFFGGLHPLWKKRSERS